MHLQLQKIKVCAVSGNHDSMERIAFGAGLMKQSGVYLSTVYDGSTQKVTLTDEFGEAQVYLLPFVRPSIVRRALGQEEIESYQDAVFAAVNHMDIDTKSEIFWWHINLLQVQAAVIRRILLLAELII